MTRNVVIFCTFVLCLSTFQPAVSAAGPTAIHTFDLAEPNPLPTSEELPVSNSIKISTHSIPFSFQARANYRYQLVLSKMPNLMGGMTQAYVATVDGFTTQSVVAPAGGIWFTAVQQIYPTLVAVTDITQVTITPTVLSAPILRVRRSGQFSNKLILIPPTWNHGNVYEYRISAAKKYATPFILRATVPKVIDLPPGRWDVAVRSGRSDTSDPSKWSKSQQFVLTAKNTLKKPSAPEHDVRDALGNPRILLTQQVSKRYWLVHGNDLIYQIGSVSRTTKTSTPIPIECGTSIVVRVVSVTSLGRYSSPSGPITLQGAPCSTIASLAPPENLQLQDATYTSVTLSFDALADENSTFMLNRNGATVGAIPGQQTSIKLDNLPDSATFQWDLYAKNSQGFVSPRPARLSAATYPPPQSTGSVRAYMLSTDMGSISDARAHYMNLDWVYPTYFEITQQKTEMPVISGQSQPSVDTWFQKRGIKVLPRILASDLSAMEMLWATPDLRIAFATQVAKIITDGNYDGIQLDFEPLYPKTGIIGSGFAETPATRAAHYALIQTDVVKQISDLLTPSGKKVSFAIPVNWCSGGRSTTTWRITYCADITHKSVITRPRMQFYDVPGLLRYSDDFFVMAWGLHWSTSEPGASGELDWIQAGVNWLKAVIAKEIAIDPTSVKAQITLGRNLYSARYYYTLARMDTLKPPGAFPKAPLCPVTQVAARARLRKPERGMLVVDWVCPELRSDKLEFSDAVSMASIAVDPVGTYQIDDGETLVTMPTTNGIKSELWVVDVKSEIDFIDITNAAGWKIGFWRLGREDQRIWDLPEVVQNK